MFLFLSEMEDSREPCDRSWALGSESNGRDHLPQIYAEKIHVRGHFVENLFSRNFW